MVVRAPIGRGSDTTLDARPVLLTLLPQGGRSYSNGFPKTRRHKYETWLPEPKPRRSKADRDNEQWKQEQKRYEPEF